jgi:hypothetical protein
MTQVVQHLTNECEALSSKSFQEWGWLDKGE